MFEKFLLSAFIVTAVFAAPSPGAPLQVSLSGPSGGVTSKDFAVTATVSNPTDEDIKVLKLNTILDNTPVRNFHLFKDDSEVSFTGFRVTPDLANDESYTVIPAGGTVTVTHDLAARFDFAASGTGKYTVQAESFFQYGADAAETASINVEEVTVEVTGVDEMMSIQQTTPQCNDGNRLNQLRGALTEARALAGGAASDTRSHPSSGTINRFFGGGNRDTIWFNLDRVAGDLPSSGTRVLDCVDPHGVCAGNSGIVAYTLLVTSGGNIVGSDIFGCNPFWGAPATNTICSGQGTGTRGSIILHELSHAVFAAKDTVYGCSGSAALADGAKIQNADNYSCFGVETYRTYNC